MNPLWPKKMRPPVSPVAEPVTQIRVAVENDGAWSVSLQRGSSIETKKYQSAKLAVEQVELVLRLES
jgi:hypothetical protein